MERLKALLIFKGWVIDPAALMFEAMSDMQFRLWANRIITTIATYCILDGACMMIWPAEPIAF